MTMIMDIIHSIIFWACIFLVIDIISHHLKNLKCHDQHKHKKNETQQASFCLLADFIHSVVAYFTFNMPISNYLIITHITYHVMIIFYIFFIGPNSFKKDYIYKLYIIAVINSIIFYYLSIKIPYNDSAIPGILLSQSFQNVITCTSSIYWVVFTLTAGYDKKSLPFLILNGIVSIKWIFEYPFEIYNFINLLDINQLGLGLKLYLSSVPIICYIIGQFYIIPRIILLKDTLLNNNKIKKE